MKPENYILFSSQRVSFHNEIMVKYILLKSFFFSFASFRVKYSNTVVIITENNFTVGNSLLIQKA